jgi:para-nitrobenzyl esterase
MNQLAGPPGTANDLGGLPFQPVVDGEILPRRAIESVARGSAAGVPVLVGSTLDEWKLFIPADPSNFTMAESEVYARAERRMGAAGKSVVDVYKKARSERGAPVTPMELWSALETDRIFRLPALRLAETQLAHESRVFNYLFTWPSPMMGGMLGSCHALELGFVFGTHSDPGMVDFSGAGPKANELSERMMDAWLAFAQTGDPSTKSLRFPRYGTAERSTTIFGEESRVESAPYDDERRAWDAAPAKALGEP